MLQSENLVLYDNTLTLLLLHPSASTALVEWSGVDRLQADSHCLQVLLAGTDTIVPCWQTLLDSKHRGSTVYIVCVLPRHCHCLTAVHGCQPSVTELFWSPALISGTVFLSTSHQHRHWPSCTAASRLITSGTASHNFTTLLSCPISDMSLRTRYRSCSYLLTYLLVSGPTSMLIKSQVQSLHLELLQWY